MVFYGARLGSAIGEVRIDLTQLFSARSIAKDVILDITGSIDESTGEIHNKFNQLSSTALVGLSAVALGGIKATESVERIEATFRLMVGSEHKATEEMDKLRQLASDTHQPFLDLLEAAAELQPTIKGTNVDLTETTSLMQRLALLDPAQGIRGAGIALRDFVTGQYLPLAFRFELPREALKGITQEAGGDPSKAIEGLDRLLSKLGLSKNAVIEYGKTAQQIFDALGDQIKQSTASAFDPLLEVLKFLAQVLTDILKVATDLTPVIGQMTAAVVALTIASGALQKVGIGSGPIAGAKAVVAGANNLIPFSGAIITGVEESLAPWGALSGLGLSTTMASAIAVLAPLATAAAAFAAVATAIYALQKAAQDARDHAMIPLRDAIRDMEREGANAVQRANNLPDLKPSASTSEALDVLNKAQQAQTQNQADLNDIQNTTVQKVFNFQDDLVQQLTSAGAGAAADSFSRAIQDLNLKTGTFPGSTTVFSQSQIDQINALLDKLTAASDSGSNADVTGASLSKLDIGQLLEISDRLFGSNSLLSQSLRELGQGSEDAAKQVDEAVNTTQQAIDNAQAVVDANRKKQIEAINSAIEEFQINKSLQDIQNTIKDNRDAFEFSLSQARELAEYQRRASEQRTKNLQEEEDLIKKINKVREDEDKQLTENIEQNLKDQRRAYEDHQIRLNDIIKNLHYALRDALIARNGAAALAALQNAKQATDKENEQYDLQEKRREEDFQKLQDDLKKRSDEQVQAMLEDLDRMKKEHEWQAAQDQAAFDLRRQQEQEDFVRKKNYLDQDRALEEQANVLRLQRSLKAIADNDMVIGHAISNIDLFGFKTLSMAQMLADSANQLLASPVWVNLPGAAGVPGGGGGGGGGYSAQDFFNDAVVQNNLQVAAARSQLGISPNLSGSNIRQILLSGGSLTGNAEVDQAIRDLYAGYHFAGGGVVPFDMFAKVHKDEVVFTPEHLKALTQPNFNPPPVYVDFSGANIGKNVTEEDLRELESSVATGVLEGIKRNGRGSTQIIRRMG